MDTKTCNKCGILRKLTRFSNDPYKLGSKLDQCVGCTFTRGEKLSGAIQKAYYTSRLSGLDYARKFRGLKHGL